MNAGVRIDFPEGFNKEVSPRVGVSYTIKQTGTRLRANRGEGFKLPSFFALGNSIVGNPALLPETSTSYDAGLSQPLWGGQAEVDISYFYNDFSNTVDFDEGPPPLLVNRSEIVTEGVEVSLTAKPMPNLSVTGHVTYVETDIRETIEELRNRPEWRGGFSLLWNPLPELDVHLNTITVGEVFDSSIPTGDFDLEPYTRVDLAVTWEPEPTWEIFLAVDNLLDADYQEFAGFPAPGITPRAGLRKTFRTGL